LLACATSNHTSIAAITFDDGRQLVDLQSNLLGLSAG